MILSKTQLSINFTRVPEVDFHATTAGGNWGTNHGHRNDSDSLTNTGGKTS